MRLTYLIILVFFISSTSFTQNIPGAKQNSMSNSGVALSNDVFSIFNNPAGLAQMNWKEVGLYYSPAPFGLKELANGYAAYNQPFSFGSIAIGGMTYGYKLYRENKVTFAFSYNYKNKFFAGAAINYHTVKIQNYGSSSAIYFNVGGLAYILKNLRWGFDIQNLNRATFGKYEDQIPVIFNSGFSYDVIKTFSLNIAIRKDIRYKASLLIGLDYNIISNLSLRTGFSNEPTRFSAGIGINFSSFSLDYAVTTHQDLGLTHQFGLVIAFSRGNSREAAIRNYLNQN